jgi:hypothetical protein
MVHNPSHKRYVGHYLQAPGGPYRAPDDVLELALYDLGQHLAGWSVEQGIGPHPVERSGRCFLAAKDYSGHPQDGMLRLYYSALDCGFSLFDDVYYRCIQVDANFVDTGGTWRAPQSERIVAETLAQLASIYEAAVDPRYQGRRFWNRVSGTWVCGQDLYPCPDDPSGTY